MFSKNVDYHMQFLKFLSLPQKCGLLYEISFPSPKTWTIICNFYNFYLFSKKRGLSYANSGISFSSPKTWTIICNFWNFFPFPKNIDYYMQFLKFLSLLKKHGLIYAIYEISFSSSKTWTIICIL